MKLSLRWLRQFIHDETLDVPRIIETLTMGGVEVEDVLDLGMISGKIVVAKVIEARPHPNSDHLSLCRVDIGVSEELSIVCGAPNVTTGGIYPCALVGAKLPDGLEIAARKVRGEKSEGMLCSAKELGLGGDHEGILPLPETYAIGEPFDAIFDLKVTPNRPDWLSVLGIARELGAMIGRQVFPPKPRFKEMLDRIDGFMQVSVPARAECPRYACRMIKGTKIAESPLWLKRALEASGLRPINNVVDVTNYVLIELGHPLHAFDYKKIGGQRIVVRLAGENESLTLIDSTELKLHPEDLVIADDTRPMALAGIMGGRDSEVTETTRDILLEAAYFDPAAIRRSARRHGLSTDASYRFERGTDRERLTLALGRAAQLIHEVSGGEIVKGMLDVQGTIADAPPIALEVSRVNSLLGVKLGSSEIASYLVNLGFEIRLADGEKLIVEVPSHRVDISRPQDLIEEVARLYGYNKIPVTLPRVAAPPVAPSVREQVWDLALDTMTALGFSEIQNFSFIGEDPVRALGFNPDAQPRVANPLSIEQAILRPSLLPGLLKTAAFNQKQHEPRLMLMEAGKVWRENARAGDIEGEGFDLALLWSGPLPLHWDGESRDGDYYDIKGTVETLVAAFGNEPIKTEPLRDSAVYHPGRAATVHWRGAAVGEVGELHPDQAAAFDLKGRINLARIDLKTMAGLWNNDVKMFHPIPKFPGSWRDIALVVDAGVPAGELLETIREPDSELIQDAKIIDVYHGEHIEAGKKSLAIRIWLRSMDRTLTEEEIQEKVKGVVERLREMFGAVLRS